jgi:hypothetical protein
MGEMSKKYHASLSSDKTIRAIEAQRRVTRFVLLEIGEHLCGGADTDLRHRYGRDYWLVPVMLAIPHEPRRKVGEILVDAVTGQLRVTEAAVAEITAQAERLAGDLVSA